MDVFKPYLETIKDLYIKTRMTEILSWVLNKYESLEGRIAWNQPMITDHGTFILGLSYAKHHISIAPEAAGIHEFEEALKKAGYAPTKMIFRIKHDDKIDYNLLARIIEFNMMDKQNHDKFWR